MHQPTRPIPQTLRSRPSKPSAWWLSYFHTYPIQSVFAITSSIGGLLLLLFFVQLHAMPDLDLAGTSAVLLAVALVGWVLAFFLTVCAFGGGWVLRDYGPEAAALRSGRGGWLLLMPTIACVGVSSWQTWCSDVSDASVLNLTIVGSISLGAVVYAWWLPGGEKRDGKTMFIYGVAYVYLSLIWFMIGGMALLSFMALAGPSEKLSDELRLLAWVLWCLGCNFVMSRPQYAKLSALFGACTVSMVVLLLFSNNGMALPKAVVRSLGLGELPVALVVTEAGCQYLNQASGQVVCQVTPNEKSALVCPALLRSRIGSPYFIGLSPYTAQGAWPANADVLPARTATVALPKSEVLSWSRIEPKPADKAKPEDKTHSVTQQVAPQPVVTHVHAPASDIWLAQQCGMPDRHLSQKQGG